MLACDYRRERRPIDKIGRRLQVMRNVGCDGRCYFERVAVLHDRIDVRLDGDADLDVRRGGREAAVVMRDGGEIVNG